MHGEATAVSNKAMVQMKRYHMACSAAVLCCPPPKRLECSLQLLYSASCCAAARMRFYFEFCPNISLLRINGVFYQCVRCAITIGYSQIINFVKPLSLCILQRTAIIRKEDQARRNKQRKKQQQIRV